MKLMQYLCTGIAVILTVLALAYYIEPGIRLFEIVHKNYAIVLLFYMVAIIFQSAFEIRKLRERLKRYEQ